jgi:hypothetical protein
MKRLLVLMAFVALVLVVADTQAFRVTTADVGGADAELRESSPDGNRGDSIEIASRVDYDEDTSGNPTGYLRNSVSYLKFNVAGITAFDLAGDIIVRTTWLNTNVYNSRIEDAGDPQGPNAGFEYFVLDPTFAGADWDEMTITPNNAPGFVCDNDGTNTAWATTKGTRMGFLGSPTAGLTYLGESLFDSTLINPAVGRMDVGQRHDLTLAPGSALHDAIVAAQATAHQTVTVIFGVNFDYTTTNTNWEGFNYTMNSKEQDPLKSDSTSPWGGLPNNLETYGGAFLPQLTNEPLIPEPATLALLGLGGLLLRRKR